MTRKFTVRIKGHHTIVPLRRPLVLNLVRSVIKIKRATVIWQYKNTDSTFGYTVTNGNASPIKTNLVDGYFTLSNLSDLLLASDISLKPVEATGKTVIDTGSSTRSVVFDGTLAKMLGFDVLSTGFSASYSTPESVSDKVADMNRGLRYVKVRCNLVDSCNSFSEKGVEDKILMTLPITTGQRLNGSVETYDVCVGAEAEMNVFQCIEFGVTDQDDNPIDIGEILLDLYLT